MSAHRSGRLSRGNRGAYRRWGSPVEVALALPPIAACLDRLPAPCGVDANHLRANGEVAGSKLEPESRERASAARAYAASLNEAMRRP